MKDLTICRSRWLPSPRSLALKHKFSPKRRSVSVSNHPIATYPALGCSSQNIRYCQLRIQIASSSSTYARHEQPLREQPANSKLNLGCYFYLEHARLVLLTWMREGVGAGHGGRSTSSPPACGFSSGGRTKGMMARRTSRRRQQHFRQVERVQFSFPAGPSRWRQLECVYILRPREYKFSFLWKRSQSFCNLVYRPLVYLVSFENGQTFVIWFTEHYCLKAYIIRQAEKHERARNWILATAICCRWLRAYHKQLVQQLIWC